MLTLEPRDVPALFAVQLLTPGAGIAGDTAATITGSLTVNSQLPTDASGATLVVANSAQEAVGLAITGTITVECGPQILTYTMGTSTVGATVAEHKAFLVSAGSILLEDMAGSPTGSDWDYNDHSWMVDVSEVQGGGGTPSIAITATSNAMEGSTFDGWFLIHRTDSAGTLTVNFTQSGSATLGADYTGLEGGSVTFQDGESDVQLFIHALQDTTIEPPETVTLTLANWETATIDFYDDDGGPPVAADDTFTTIHDHPLFAAGGLLLNDSNPNGAPLRNCA